MIFDILKNDFAYSTSNNPNIRSQQYLYEDDQQFNVFALCRTSDLWDSKNIKKDEKELIQRIKY